MENNMIGKRKPSIFTPRLFNESIFDFLEQDMYNSYTHKNYSFDRTDNELIFKFMVAGLSKDDIDVNVKKDILSVKSKDVVEPDDSFAKAVQYNISLDKYSDQLDYSKTTAKANNGVLVVKIPFSKESKISFDVKVE